MVRLPLERVASMGVFERGGQAALPGPKLGLRGAATRGTRAAREADARTLCGQSRDSRPRLRASHDQIVRHMGNESAWRVVWNDGEMVIWMLPRRGQLNRLCSD